MSLFGCLFVLLGNWGQFRQGGRGGGYRGGHQGGGRHGNQRGGGHHGDGWGGYGKHTKRGRYH